MADNFLEEGLTVEDFMWSEEEIRSLQQQNRRRRRRRGGGRNKEEEGAEAAGADGQEEEEEEEEEGEGGEHFPEIDLSLPDAELVTAVCRACASWGFFRIVQHGVPAAVVEQVRRHGLRFFQELPLPLKLRIRKASPLPQGYFSSSLNAPIKSWSEALSLMPGISVIHGLLAAACVPSWSDEELQAISADLDEYTCSMNALANRILGILFQGLDVDPQKVKEIFDVKESSLRINYYPACAKANACLGSPPHTDFGGLAILYQDNVGGLEIFKNGRWIFVEPKEGSLIVNVGDIIQVLSNAKYKSVLHRSKVHNCESRMSFVFFHNPARRALIAPFSNLVSDEQPTKYQKFIFEDYRATFPKAKLGKHSPTCFFEV